MPLLFWDSLFRSLDGVLTVSPSLGGLRRCNSGASKHHVLAFPFPRDSFSEQLGPWLCKAHHQEFVPLLLESHRHPKMGTRLPVIVSFTSNS